MKTLRKEYQAGQSFSGGHIGVDPTFPRRATASNEKVQLSGEDGTSACTHPLLSLLGWAALSRLTQ